MSDLSILADVPSVAGWVLFGLTLLAWALDRIFGWSKSRAETDKLKLEIQTLKLEALAEASATKRSQLEAISAVLAADRGHPSADVVEAFARSLPFGRDTAGIADHLRARQRARQALPHLIADVLNLQEQAETVRRDVVRGIVAGDHAVTEIHKALESASERINQVITDVATSPRIFVSLEEPDAANDGDVWFQVGVDGDSPAG
ncbi:hypothetical protein [Micromonospora sp. NPDC093277]|uniref:hypothetical protein n=1 Tax=Micromonospora sp. NPDC093277 TaxID=3364291 RepID=UPI003827F16B